MTWAAHVFAFHVEVLRVLEHLSAAHVGSARALLHAVHAARYAWRQRHAVSFAGLQPCIAALCGAFAASQLPRANSIVLVCAQFHHTHQPDDFYCFLWWSVGALVTVALGWEHQMHVESATPSRL